jgi:hypothetical protein
MIISPNMSTSARGSNAAMRGVAGSSPCTMEFLPNGCIAARRDKARPQIRAKQSGKQEITA